MSKELADTPRRNRFANARPLDFRNRKLNGRPNMYLPNAGTWVAEIEGEVVGFIALIGNEVGAIFVDTGFHHRGAGRALMDKARELRGDLEVEVFEKNQIGRRFYANYGFELMEEKIHEQTGNALLRLSYSC